MGAANRATHKVCVSISALCLILAGCGAGPKHLPKSQFVEAQQAFDLLQKAEHSGDVNVGDRFADMAAAHVRRLPKGSEIEMDYRKYLSVVINAPLDRSLVALDDGPQADQAQVEKDRAKVAQDNVMLEVCRGNAERWIHAGITYHPECTQKLYGME